MLLKANVLARIVAGDIDLVFRRWKRASVKAGGTQLTQVGVLGIDAVDIVSEDRITSKDARRAGFASRKELLASLPDGELELYRIRVHYIGEDPRIALRVRDDLDEVELEEIIARLAKMDKASRYGNWTQKFLQLIAENPATLAAKLAARTGLETPVFKPMVRKLKALGLTESLEIGYRLSPRGENVLTALNKQR
ncbi:MAG: hypothetical protein AAB288_11450 [Acidobacteriota bacterium]